MKVLTKTIVAIFPWAKVAFSAYGDVFSCPHYRVGNLNDGSQPISWQSDRKERVSPNIKDGRNISWLSWLLSIRVHRTQNKGFKLDPNYECYR
ncbi:MAG: hypothetical protein CM1200mP16_16190 [Nitrospina sp.]|nr:MAG: hypothetical protein CM1200mP16_16190 [Nitrospina sp.]